jgi:hypothetical protein
LAAGDGSVDACDPPLAKAFAIAADELAGFAAIIAPHILRKTKGHHCPRRPGAVTRH